ncbi:MAG: Kae1-associated serine/threonine protein kinase [Candidatus Auribacter fodinae]|uniref:non-specific serine/threonine protein kinase n=1 Tax=Candidatus Auribacter fodinae TaxID=2093366 RepID=A0A3A4QRW6_9BACT|nr:MAG: Kae1-associated serine/threonine protein kinase [Candidatus Auribacter fodinae]
MFMMLGQGAEAIIRKVGDSVVKERVQKEYRLPVIDEKLRARRTRSEAKMLEKLAKAGVPVPKVLSVDDERMALGLSFLDGQKLRDVLESSPSLAFEFGKIVGKMHAEDIVHGDLTTSNVIHSGNVLHLIDFGLSFVSAKVEDKAVDLHVLDRALESTHYGKYAELLASAFDGYRAGNPNASVVLERLEVVRKRGRNKK